MNPRLRPLSSLAGFGFILVVFAGAARASLRDAVLVREMLADLTGAQVVRLEVRSPASRAVAHDVYGVVFRLERWEWLFTAEYGTSFLGASGATPETSTTLLRRLQQTTPEVRQVSFLAHAPPSIWKPGQVGVTNACVPGSVALLARLLARQDLPEAGLVLLTFHAPDEPAPRPAVIDHSVLVYRQGRHWMCLDPRAPDRPFAVANVAVGAPLDPALVELALRARYPLARAQFLRFGSATLEQIKANALWRVAGMNP